MVMQRLGFYTDDEVRDFLGVDQVDNTPDVDKPVSVPQQTALDAKLDDSQAGVFGLSWLGTATLAAAKTLLALVKADVGLGNVDNTSDANKPVSTATQTALDLKLDDTQAGAFGLTWLGTATLAAAKTLLALVKGDVGLGNVDNTSDATKFANTTLTGATTIDELRAITFKLGGWNTALPWRQGSSATGSIQHHVAAATGATFGQAMFAYARYINGAGYRVVVARSESPTQGTQAAITNTAVDLGSYNFLASDGTDFRDAAGIRGFINNAAVGASGFEGRVEIHLGAPTTGALTKYATFSPNAFAYVGTGTFSGYVTAGQSSVASNPAPTLGALDTTKTSLFLSPTGLFGLLFGIDGATGNCWVQAQRTDGAATAYDITWNPSGGTVKVPTATAGSNDTKAASTAYVRAASPLGRWRSLFVASAHHIAGKVAGTYALSHGDTTAVTGTGTLYPVAIVYIDSTEFASFDGVAAKMRVKAQLFVNDVAPTGNFTFGLHPVTRPATSGAAGLVIYTLGAAVASSTAAINAPAADSSNQATSAAFAVPATGYYALCVVTTATVAVASHLHMTAMLQANNA